MKKSIPSNKIAILWLVTIFSSIFLVSNISALWSIMWYGSSWDYSNPVNTFSWNVIISSWSLSATLTQAVQISNNWVSVIIPNWTVIGNSNWVSLDINQISTSSLPTLPLNLPESELDVWKINFWINWQKLNFSKPVKLSIPVSTNNSTVKIKVKHFGVEWYQTNALTDTLTSSCNNGIASSNSNIAPVSSWIATIYTCSASQFIAVIDRNVNTTSRWGGGWVRLLMDNCPDWDYSPSYYDRTCWVKPIESKDWLDNKVETNNKLNEISTIKWGIKRINYKWVEIVVYEWYNISERAFNLSVRIINMNRLTLKEKNNYVNRVNEYLIAKYNFDNSIDKTWSVRNKLNKEVILLIWATEKIKKDIKRF